MIDVVAKTMQMMIDATMRRVKLLVSRGTVAYSDDSKSTQSVQLKVYGDDVTFPIENVAPYGFRSVPPDGTDALQICVGSERSNAIAIALGRREDAVSGKPAGTVVIYTPAGTGVVCKPDGSIHIGVDEAAAQKVARADRVEQKLNELINHYNAHTHAFSGSATVDTSTGVGTCSGTASAIASGHTAAAQNSTASDSVTCN